VERRLDDANEDEKRAQVREYLDRFRAEGVDAVALGCTHFLFLLEEFRREAAPDITVFDSVEGISRRIETLLEGCAEKPDVSANKTAGENLLIITGPEAPEASWRRWADRLGFRLSLLEELCGDL
jgi:glutamate racemase